MLESACGELWVNHANFKRQRHLRRAQPVGRLQANEDREAGLHLLRCEEITASEYLSFHSLFFYS